MTHRSAAMGSIKAYVSDNEHVIRDSIVTRPTSTTCTS